MPKTIEAYRSPTLLLITVGTLLLPWSWFVNLWFAPRRLGVPIFEASFGLIHPSMLVCLPTVLLILGACRLAGLQASDLGLGFRTLPKAIVATVLLWVVTNLVAIVGSPGELAWSTHGDLPLTWVLGKLLGQLLGNALFEELVYRGLFLTQFVLILRARGMGNKRAAWLAALLSAILFAVPHIPNRILQQAYDSPSDVIIDQVKLLASGMIFAWIYLRTKNLWWCIGLHSIANHPTLLFSWNLGGSPKDAIAVFTVLMTVAWPWIPRASKGQKRASEP